jgi:LmbE family N-acetylglucosaminyl deacetylase
VGPRVLVVAPHPDDDVIGCGGTLHRCASRGAFVLVVYVTDGSASHPASLSFSAERIAALREGEARRALLELSIQTEPLFLRVRDGTVGQLATNDREFAAVRIADAVRDFGIDTIFEPWAHDPHPDHIATAALVARSVALLAPPLPRRLAYFVWTGLRDAPAAPGEVLEELGGLHEREDGMLHVELDSHDVAAKRRALLRHQTQIGGLIDDDPAGFRIDRGLMEAWLKPGERFQEIRSDMR